MISDKCCWRDNFPSFYECWFIVLMYVCYCCPFVFGFVGVEGVAVSGLVMYCGEWVIVCVLVNDRF